MKLSLLVMAAGMGSRYGGLKQIDGFGPSGECILEYSVYDALRAGFDHLVLVIRKDIEEEFREIVGRKLEGVIDVDYVFQEKTSLPEGYVCPDSRIKPWGTGHAALVAKDVISNNFACINADDFYGADSFKRLGEFLKSTDPESHDYALVAYELGKTLSDYGSVSRGICTIGGDGCLEHLLEHTHVTDSESGPIHTRLDGDIVQLTYTTPANMNFFGFTPKFFEVLDKEFRLFLDKNLEEPKFEFYLPHALDMALADFGATCRVMQTDADWFGVTNPEDKSIFQKAIKEKATQGVYPNSLWQ